MTVLWLPISSNWIVFFHLKQEKYTFKFHLTAPLVRKVNLD